MRNLGFKRENGEARRRLIVRHKNLDPAQELSGQPDFGLASGLLSPLSEIPIKKLNMSKQNGSFDFNQLLPLGLLAVAALVLYFAMSDGSSSLDKTQSARSAEVQETVNKHLEKTAEMLEMQRRRMQIENSRLALDYGRTVAERPYAAPKEGAELIEEAQAHRVAEDIGATQDANQALPSNPMDLIHHQLFEAQAAAAADVEYKKEYARQFVENGRRAGWDITLDENFKVISVKPYKRAPTNDFQLFQ
jgi:hypothetical protein